MTDVKAVYWVGTSLNDLKAFPGDVKDNIGYAIYDVQRGITPAIAKPLKGFGGASVQELRTHDSQNNTYRTVYTVKFNTGVYVLHAFQKKSKKGGTTPKTEIDKIKQRLIQAEEEHKGRLKQENGHANQRENRNKR